MNATNAYRDFFVMTPEQEAAWDRQDAARQAREREGWSYGNDFGLARMLWGPLPIPANAVLRGVIRRPDGRQGALLAFIGTGIHVQGNAGCLSSLDQQAIRDIAG